MKQHLQLLIAVAVATAGAGTVAMAAETPLIATLSYSSTTASLVCRAAKPGELTSATTAANTGLVCKPLDMRPIMAAKPAVIAMEHGEFNWRELLSDFNVQDRGK
jgi:hypothetical protein